MSKEITFYLATGGQVDLPGDCLVHYLSWRHQGMLFAIAGTKPEDADRLICDRSICCIDMHNDGLCNVRTIGLFSEEDDLNGKKYQNKYESVYVGRYGTIFIYIGNENVEDLNVANGLDEIDVENKERNMI